MDTESNTDGTLLVGATNDSALLLRHEFLTQGRQAVEDFLAELEDTINHDQDQHLLLRNEIDSKIRKLMATVNEMKAQITTSHTVFTTRCQPILERTLPLPASIINKSDTLLRLLEGEENDDDNDDNYYDVEGEKLTETLTVTQFDMVISDTIEYILRDPMRGNDVCLDIDRDTLEEVTNMLQLYPMNGDDPPRVITKLLPRSIAFIPTILSLWMKQTNTNMARIARREGNGYFRGGVNIAKLVKTPSAVQNKILFDERCANVLTWFIKEGLFGNEADQPLVPYLIDELIRNSSRFFAEQRFQVLVRHFPSVLDHVNDLTGRTPLQEVCQYPGNVFQSFLSVFKAGLQKLPPNQGILLLFQKVCVRGVVSDKSPYNFLDAGSNVPQTEETLRRGQAIEDILNNPAMYPTSISALSGWVETWDAMNNRNYYYNRATRAAQWERPVSPCPLFLDSLRPAPVSPPSYPPPPELVPPPPPFPPLPSGWAEIWHATKNKNWYYNATTRAKQWKRPVPPTLYRALANPNDMDTHHHCRRPYDPAQTLFAAATSEQIVLDGVYFFLRRDPDVLKKLLVGTNNNNRNQNRDTKQKRSNNTERADTSLHKKKAKTK